MQSLPALRFHPLLKHYLWGGSKLQQLLGKPVPHGMTCAESWEIVDHGLDQSVVVDGPLAGISLHEIATRFAPALYGQQKDFPPRFPLLLKFLDAQLDLSLQVHPNDAQAALLSPPDLGKSEAWYVLHASPGSKIHAGLLPNIDEPALRQAIAQGRCQDCLYSFDAQVNDCVFLKAGTVHALGAGTMIAEIQQSSDTTYRLDDWNRLGPDGKPRPLHVEEGIAVTDFRAGPVLPAVPQATEEEGRETLVDCDKFRWDRMWVSSRRSLGGDGRCHVCALVQGVGALYGDHGVWNMKAGDSWLVPASTPCVEFLPQENCILLDAMLPLHPGG